MTNPLQEKIVKEFWEKFGVLEIVEKKDGVYFGDGRMSINDWLTTTLEEVYKAGKDEGYRDGYLLGFEKTLETATVVCGQIIENGTGSRLGFVDGCGEPVELLKTFACLDCSAPFHRQCLIKHVAKPMKHGVESLKEKEIRESSFKEGEKNGLSRAVGAVKELKKSPDCGQNPDYPVDQCTPTCGYNNAIEKAIKAIESLN